MHDPLASHRDTLRKLCQYDASHGPMSSYTHNSMLREKLRALGGHAGMQARHLFCADKILCALHVRVEPAVSETQRACRPCCSERNRHSWPSLLGRCVTPVDAHSWLALPSAP